ncbi:MAG: methyltransferase domain-containing protein [Cellvibrionaceae bacterium]
MGIFDAAAKLIRWANGRHGPRDLQQTMTGLKGWQRTALGKAITEEQKSQLDQLMPELFGYHLLEMSCFDVSDLSNSSRINHRFSVAPDVGVKAPVISNFEDLPLASESLDVVLLHHILDYSPSPHQILREANRVLIARGHLIVIGFNPWSLQGLYKLAAQWVGAGDFWRRRSLRAGRVLDWLRLLDCDPIKLERGFYRAPVNHANTLGRFQFWERLCRKMKLPFGGYYIILARKDRVSVRPIKPLWRNINPIAGLGLAKPTTRLPEPSRKNTHKPYRGSE